MIELDFQKNNGLIPVVTQDYLSGEVLMLANISPESWQETLTSGQAVYYSRSRKKLWRKGEESGNIQLIREILVDCDADSVLFKVEQIGGAACHTGHRSCFFRKISNGGTQLEEISLPVFDPLTVYHQNLNISNFLAELRTKLSLLTLKENVPYSKLTTLGVGSELPLLAEPQNIEELTKLLQFTSKRHVPVFILGGGTNLVGTDDPFPLLGIRLKKTGFSNFQLQGNVVKAGSALKLSELANRATECGLGGLAKLAGIPGTIGGALRMNAGTGETSIGNFVLKVDGIDLQGNPWSADSSNLKWNYRQSSIPTNVIITSAEFKLLPVNPKAEIQAIRAEIERRQKHDPTGRSAGCVFRNVSDNEPAGKLIDECGFKDYQIGDLTVSNKHANFIINLKEGREADFIELLRHIRATVAEKLGYYLQPEVQFINPKARQQIEEAAHPPKVCVLLGGTSNEREISLKSGAAVAQALRNSGFEVITKDITECKLLPEMTAADVVYPVLHGGFGEDGQIQRVMENAQLRFVGSGSTASLIAMDKIATKRLLDRLGIPTAKWTTVTRQNHELPPELKLPVIIKVPMEGSTFGIERVTTKEEWNDAIEKELAMADELLVEEYINGIEITVPIVNGNVLPAIEIRSPHGFYDYDAKYVYQKGHTEYFCPVQSLPPEQIAEASRQAYKFYRGANCRDILRVDFIVDPHGVPFMLEGNSIPGCTATSLVPKAAKVSGISFEKMTSSLVMAAMKRGNPHRNI